MGLTDKVVIVTGASRGIGRQLAVELGRRGARVVVAARTVEPRRVLPGTIGETVRLVEQAGGTALAVACDVARPKDLERLVDTTVATFGRLDAVVNNAADMVGQDLEQMVEMLLDPAAAAAAAGGTQAAAAAPPIAGMLASWMQQFAVNVHAPFQLMLLSTPHLRAQGGGVIVNISSSAAEMVPLSTLAAPGNAGRARTARNRSLGYAATKAALNRMTNAAAVELAADRIAVVAVAPGATLTELADLMGEHGFVGTRDFVPMSVQVQAVLDVLDAEDPMIYSGQIVRTYAEVTPGVPAS